MLFVMGNHNHKSSRLVIFINFYPSHFACRRYRRTSTAVVAPSSATSRDYHRMSRHTRPSTATSTCLSADHPTTSRNADRADPESDGSTRSGRTTGFHQRTCGEVRLLVATEEQCYGPRWLRDDDDDFLIPQFFQVFQENAHPEVKVGLTGTKQ